MLGGLGAPELLVLLVLGVGLVAAVLFFRARGSGEALAPCRACRRKLSPRAETCPHCGEPRQVLRG